MIVRNTHFVLWIEIAMSHSIKCPHEYTFLVRTFFQFKLFNSIRFSEIINCHRSTTKKKNLWENSFNFCVAIEINIWVDSMQYIHLLNSFIKIKSDLFAFNATNRTHYTQRLLTDELRTYYLPLRMCWSTFSGHGPIISHYRLVHKRQ